MAHQFPLQVRSKRYPKWVFTIIGEIGDLWITDLAVPFCSAVGGKFLYKPLFRRVGHYR